MDRLIILFLGLIFLVSVFNFYMNASSFPLGQKTCPELIAQLRSKDPESPKKSGIREEMKQLFYEQIDIFRRGNPDVYAKHAKKIEELNENPQARSRFFVHQVCDAPERSAIPLGRNIQIALAQKFAHTADESCKIIQGKSASYFGISGDSINICSGANFSKYTLSRPPDKIAKAYKNQKILQFCVDLIDPVTREVSEECQLIKGTKEEQCLSTHGECKKLELGCGWQHTDQSRSCSAQ